MIRISNNSIVVLLFLISSSAFTNGDEYKSDGNELLRDCKANIEVLDNPKKAGQDDFIKLTSCLNILHGLLDMHEIYTQMFNSPKIFCVPESVNLGQLAQVVVKYLNDNPQILHELDTLLIIKALKNAYPCKAN